MFDVLEHLADPVTTLEAVSRSTTEEALLAIQTPEFNDRRGADWPMFLSPEHTFLFTRDGMERLLRQVGFNHVQFQPHVLFQENMLAFASRQPLRPHPPEQVDAALLATPGGRVVLGLLDQLPRGFGQDLSFKVVMNELRHGRDWVGAFGTKQLTGLFARSLWRSLARRLRF
jgi:hypothetical protein